MSLTLKLRKPDVQHLMLGGAGIAGMFQVVSVDQAVKTLEKAIELGITEFDTAPWYGAGRSEEYFGQAFCNKNNLQITTKVGRVIKKKSECNPDDPRVAWGLIPTEFKLDGNSTEDIPVHDYSETGAWLSYKGSCERMKDVTIKCIRLHDAENHERPECHYFDQAVSVGGAMEALIKMKSDKLVDEISLGMNSPEYLLRFISLYPNTFDNIMMAGSWNLLDLTGHDLLVGIDVILAGIWGGGMLWGENVLRYKPASQEDIDRRNQWSQLCKSFNCSLPAVALHFAFLPTCVKSVCIGARSPDNVVTNVALCNEIVPPQIWQEAKNQGLLPEWFKISN